MDLRTNRLRNLLLNDDRSRGDVVDILDVCLKHLVPHNHNHYNIYLNHTPSRHITPEDNNNANNSSMDITSSINNLVDAIVSEVSNSPIDIQNNAGISSRDSTSSRSTQATNTDGNYEILISDTTQSPSYPPNTNNHVGNINDVVTVAEQSSEQVDPTSTDA
jgi:hypothetical protein